MRQNFANDRKTSQTSPIKQTDRGDEVRDEINEFLAGVDDVLSHCCWPQSSRGLACWSRQKLVASYNYELKGERVFFPYQKKEEIFSAGCQKVNIRVFSYIMSFTSYILVVNILLHNICSKPNNKIKQKYQNLSAKGPKQHKPWTVGLYRRKWIFRSLQIVALSKVSKTWETL